MSEIMISFREIQLADKPLLDSYLHKATAPICDYTFVNIYAWQTLYQTVWAEVEGALVVRFWLDGEYGYMVVGAEDYARVMTALLAEAKEAGARLRLVGMTSGDAERFKAWAAENGGMERFAICDNPDYRDYIYSVEDLSTLSGRKYQPKRNHINKFESKYTYEFKELTPEYFQECLCLECRWQLRKAVMDNPEVVKEHKCKDTAEKIAIRRAFDAFDELGLYGGVLLVDGHVAAFTYGSAISDDTFCTHIEKADSTMEGIFPMINRCFARALAERGFVWVNREEDMGLAGLRRSKNSFYPVRLQEKIGVREITIRETECRALWMEVFNDEREEVDRFLIDIHREDNLLTHRENDRVVAMLNIVKIDTDYGPTAYLYAIVTSPDFRGKGYASALISQAIELAREREYKAVMLIPSEISLVEYYKRFGFSEPTYKLDFSNGYDLGTGNTEHNIAMTLML